ncbi:MAG: hypothetical protein DDG58_04960 [Ardenticatenia bacterium]|jgi:hypothetical protein|nr:MAG: hypothetical protein DDG58_04960 [Ardenticatenia bacterium]
MLLFYHHIDIHSGRQWRKAIDFERFVLLGTHSRGRSNCAIYDFAILDRSTHPSVENRGRELTINFSFARNKG